MAKNELAVIDNFECDCRRARVRDTAGQRRR